MLEKEVRTPQDMPIVAGILWKRLDSGWPLQADATLQYALGYQGAEKTWWKKTLFETDKEINSPYNTYQQRGLPPASIANPGLLSIRAVAFPKDSPYWYYLHDREGGIHYAQTLEEHERNIENYLR